MQKHFDVIIKWHYTTTVEQFELFMSVGQFFDVVGIRFWGGYIKGVLHKYC